MLHLQAWCYALFLSSLVPTAFSYISFTEINPPFPQSPISNEWQDYFRVTAPLPNITFPLPQSYAGNLPVDREGHPNNTLYFWGFEKSPGSLTAPLDPSNKDPWGIWLNGPPTRLFSPATGTSGLQGLLLENGPIQINPDYTASPNPYAWNNLADYFWIDQPVGSGYSTTDANATAESGEQIGDDFMKFLINLVKVFPSLATRPLHLTGERMAGYYIPYIMKSYFEMENPPVKVAKIAIGSGAYIAAHVGMQSVGRGFMQTFPQLIDYDPEVYEYFEDQLKLCGLDVNLTYPQTGKIHIENPIKTFPLRLYQKSHLSKPVRRAEEDSNTLVGRALDKDTWKLLNPKGVLDPYYNCVVNQKIRDYAKNYTFPWNQDRDSLTSSTDLSQAIDIDLQAPLDTRLFLNEKATIDALHSPISPFKRQDTPLQSFTPDEDKTSITLFDDLAANASAHNIAIILFSGNNDAVLPHFGTEIAIQNTTFGGIQGFTRKPSTPWTDDSGEFAGIVHQERGWTYALFYGAGHYIPRDVPRAAYTFLKEFILGDNKTGLVTSIQGHPAIIGGEDPSLAGNIPAAPEIFYGEWTNPLVYIAPSAKREAWAAYIATATAAPSPQRREIPSAAPWFSTVTSAALPGPVFSGLTMISSVMTLVMATLFF